MESGGPQEFNYPENDGIHADAESLGVCNGHLNYVTKRRDATNSQLDFILKNQQEEKAP